MFRCSDVSANLIIDPIESNTLTYIFIMNFPFFLIYLEAAESVPDIEVTKNVKAKGSHDTGNSRDIRKNGDIENIHDTGNDTNKTGRSTTGVTFENV